LRDLCLLFATEARKRTSQLMIVMIEELQSSLTAL